MKILSAVRKFLPHWLVNYIYHLPLSFLAVCYYGYPAKNLQVIGVTGTDGKTTTSTLIYEILKKAAKKVALITSVSAKIGDQDLDTGFHVTTPDPWELQKLLKLIKDRGFEYVVLEVTSHGLAQFRLFGCNFKIGVLTNITWEHIDYHKTWENYLQAKQSLFKKTHYSILNADDKSYKYLKNNVGGKVITYGLKKADFTPQNFPFKTRLPGIYNQSNCLAAIACCKQLAIDDKTIKTGLLKFPGVIGRMEVMQEKPFKVIIDFAHTPNALQNALLTLKNMTSGKVIAVFGCAGLRDYKKRPQMGRIAEKLADKVIITSEDPRTEDINKINRQILFGVTEKKKFVIENDRFLAIKKAINLAGTGDIIGIFGKGHEKSLCFGKTEYPWSDQQAVRKILKKRG